MKGCSRGVRMRYASSEPPSFPDDHRQPRLISPHFATPDESGHRVDALGRLHHAWSVRRPVALERFVNLPHDVSVMYEHPHFAPRVELRLAQALTAHERRRAIAYDRAQVQPTMMQLFDA